MPYALIEKKREYQRKWMRERSRTDRNEALNAVGAINLRKGVVTYAELVATDYFNKVPTWECCVKKSKEYLIGSKTNRLVIAALAIRACTIRHGGDRRSTKWKLNSCDPTLKKFSIQLGVNHKTLCDWIRVKQHIVDLLPASATNIDYHAARLALENKKNNPSITIESLYQKYQKNNALKGGHYIIRYLRNTKSHVEKYGLRGIPKEDLIQIKETLEYLMHSFESIQIEETT